MKPFRMTLAASLAAFATALGFVACERHANLRDEPTSGGIVQGPGVDAGPIPVVDSGLETDAYLACPDRPTGDCVGSNDFLCGFEDWVVATAKTCQTQSGCKTNGWLEVKMGADGCVAEIRMDQPNDEVVACLVAEFGEFHCPCPEVESSYYFGEDNSGVCAKP